MIVSRPTAFVLCIVWFGFIVGCGEVETPTSPTTEVVPPRIVVFSGNLAVGGSRFYSFSASQPGQASLLLGSLTRGVNGPSVPAAVELGLGVPRGTGCALISSATTSSALTAQVVAAVQSGIYCAQIADTGTLAEPAAFAIRITFP